MGAVEISLLGGFQIRRDGETLPPMPLRAARSLFAYLVLNRNRAHTRDLLIGTFWPDLPESKGRRRLSHALWQIQSSIGEGCLITSGDSVRFDPDADFWLDVDEFEWTIEQAAPETVPGRSQEAELLAAAVDLYRGDLLAGFYDDWVFPDQERLRQRLAGILDRLTNLAMGRSDYDSALVYARRLTQHDPLRETAHRKVMRIAVLLRRYNDAIRQFEQCRSLLRDQIGADPEPDTLALYEEILAERESGGSRSVSPPQAPLFDQDATAPFVGREPERASLVERLDAAIEGNGSVMLVEGESGVGKTRLLAEAVEDARWRGLTVVWGSCTPSGGRPYEPIAEALGPSLGQLAGKRLAGQLDPVWRNQLALLVPGIGEPGPVAGVHLRRADERERMHEAVAVAFEALSRLGPVLIVLEDVHWADEDTVAAVGNLIGRVAGLPILLALTYRHAEARERAPVWDLLRTADRQPHGHRLSLTPCSPAQTEELIRRSLGVPEVSAEFSDRVHRETGGIPLFVVETLWARHEHADEADAGADRPSERGRLPVTPTVRRLIEGRLDALDHGSSATLDLISVHDGDLMLAEIVAASEAEEFAVLDAVDDLVKRRLISEREGAFRVSHELMRRVVYDRLRESTRLDLHRRVALAIERQRSDQVESLAHHFATAAVHDRAADYLEQAAAHAIEVHAYNTAALHLERAAAALAVIDAPGSRRYSVAALQEEVLDTLARREDQEQALELMDRFAAPGQRGDVHRRRAWWLAHVDRFPEAEAAARTAFGLARERDDGGAAVAALTALGMIACWAGRAAEGVTHLEAAAGFSGADRQQQVDARNALGQNLIDLQRFDEAESQLLAALALYGEVNDARGRADVMGMLATLRMERGEPDRAAADYEQALEISRRIGWRHGEAVYQLNLGILEGIRGRIGAARDAFDAAADTYAAMGNNRGRAMVLANGAWLRHAYLGEDERAERDNAEALMLYREIGELRGESQCLGTQGSLAARLGAWVEARSLLGEAIALARRVEDAWLTAQMLRQLAEAELQAGDPIAGLGAIEEAAAICASTGMHDLAVGIGAVRGRLLLAAGRLDEARSATEAAAAELRPGIDQGYLVPHAHALVLRALGDHEQADRRLEEARRLLDAALADLDPADRKTAIRRVPAHLEIAEEWARRRPISVTVRIAAASAPSGRALDESEHVTVTWTVDAPADRRIDDPIERRRARLLRLVAEASGQGGAPTVVDLAGALQASVATVRRDLAALRNAGHRVATRGSRSG